MDIDRYVVTNRGEWGRLAALTARAHRKPSSLSTEEVTEFLRLYQRASSQLSFVRSHYDSPALTAELNTLVGDANAVIYRRTAGPVASIRRFFAVSFPAAVWHVRRFVGVAALVFFLPAIVTGLWLAGNEAALEAIAPDEAQRAAYVERDFEDYYRSEPAAQFSTYVLTNNIQVSFLAFAGGFVFGVGSIYILAFNGLNLGAAWALFIVAGRQGHFFGLILPHGLLEISAILVAGAAGMSLGFALLAPGDRTRGQAVMEEGRRATVVILGLMLMFVIAGLIEGFITPGLPLVPRLLVGVSAFTAFVVYVVSQGRRAAALGFTGLRSDEMEGHRTAAMLTV